MATKTKRRRTRGADDLRIEAQPPADTTHDGLPRPSRARGLKTALAVVVLVAAVGLGLHSLLSGRSAPQVDETSDPATTSLYVVHTNCGNTVRSTTLPKTVAPVTVRELDALRARLAGGGSCRADQVHVLHLLELMLE